MSPDRTAPRPPGRVSRRRLVGWSAMAAAALPLGGAGRAVAATTREPVAASTADPVAVTTADRPGATGADPIEASYQQAFQQAVAADQTVRQHTVRGREFLYRARQLLVAPADFPRVLTVLRSWGHPVTEGVGFAGVRRLLFTQETDVPAVVTKLRSPQQWPGQPVPLVQPHHVLVGFGNIMGNPGAPPLAAPALPAPDPTRLGEGAGVTVGVCDTGIWRRAGAVHPQWLGGSYLPETDDEDPLYVSGNLLALQGGHGTFVAGVVRQAAPGVRFDPEAALSPTGVGDEQTLTAALARLGTGTAIVNLSLGYFTQDDLPPLPVANALAGLRPPVAVVAAAGNAGSARKSWPAALDGVLAVAAVTRDGAALTPAAYSSFGSWVDVCAIGDHVSTYVDGELRLPGQPALLFNGFAAWSGTSFATAHVSGRLAALMTSTGLGPVAARDALAAGPRWHPDYGVLVG
ncbi:S8 family serine peptidase [Micromonospora sp. WMMD882]|uniref:S8 family peptidase n=1 Tax=Micromonospora sp. WMMD882 TaxID=3015151 RepID=UPI00248B2571|nr:S8 family serine peptidase [Micromonospora sp. WMMD882]WBB78757.1 S8 family serine peptidase [Micromonospora sp. WMMD882]